MNTEGWRNRGLLFWIFVHDAQSFSNSFKGVVGFVRKSRKSSFCVLLHFYDQNFWSLLRGYMRSPPPPPFNYSIHRVQFVADMEARELKPPAMTASWFREPARPRTRQIWFAEMENDWWPLLLAWHQQPFVVSFLFVNWGEVRWGEVRWGEVRWGEVRWGEVRWGEVKRY